MKMQLQRSGPRLQRQSYECRRVHYGMAVEKDLVINNQLTCCCPALHPHTDLTELELPSTMTIEHPDPEKKLQFELTIQPDEG